MKRNYCILIQWPKGGYSLLWERKGVTLDEAKAALASAQKGWPNTRSRQKGRQIFICSPKRAKRLLTYTKNGRKCVNNLPLGLK